MAKLAGEEFLMGKRFIEQDFPIEWLNGIALGEGNSKKPIYRMHKWWARRLGSVFRTILLTTFEDADTNPQNIWHQFSNGANLAGKIVLDPFVGGGTTLVEALRLGCRVIGTDINPVAWFVTKKEIEPVDLSALDAAFQTLQQNVGQRIQEYYHTTCPQGHPADVIYYFWVKTAHCESCGRLNRLFPNFELSREDDRLVSICPNCLQIVESSPLDSPVTCPECGTCFEPRHGNVSRGVFRCVTCGHEQKILDAVAKKGERLEMELHALEGYCASCGRFFKRIDEEDYKRWLAAKNEFESRKDMLLFPRQAIPTEGRSDPRPVNHGYRYFWQMFNERQLLALSMLLEHILQIPDQNIRELMLLAFSDSLNTNNMFCKYEVEWHKISLFFSLHAFHPIERPAENNVWGTAYGRGTFVKCFEKVRKAKKYAQAPYERLLNAYGQRYTRYIGQEKIEGFLVESFDQLQQTERGALLRCQSAEDLSHIPDASVDAVITDPPYFDNVQYSELADFFYVWLRLGLKDIYPWFAPELSGNPAEIVKNETMGKTTEFFNEGLRRVFQECHRVLKDEGLLVFTFHHAQPWAWEGIAKALLKAGFFVVATPIVRSEGRGEVHSSEGNIRYDCIFVCRKQPYSGDIPKNLPQQILKDALFWAQRTVNSGMRVNEVDIFTILMAKTIEYYTKQVSLINPSASTDLQELIQEMGQKTEAILRQLEIASTVRSPSQPTLF